MRALLALLLFPALFAADLSGIWVGQVPPRRPGDDPQDIEFKLDQQAGLITGKLYGPYKSTPIVEGKITGNDVVFYVILSEQSGNQINDTRLKFSGTLQGGELELTRERQKATIAGNGGSVFLKDSGKTTFRLKRLL